MKNEEAYRITVEDIIENEDGTATLIFDLSAEFIEWFKKKRGMYFSKKGYELVGIEVPIEYDLPNDIRFIGYIDIVLHDTLRDRYKIIDIKTSTMGWNKYMKADKNKSNQLLLYKQFYSKQFDIPMDRIDVEFFIVKRNINKLI